MIMNEKNVMAAASDIQAELNFRLLMEQLQAVNLFPNILWVDEVVTTWCQKAEQQNTTIQTHGSTTE